MTKFWSIFRNTFVQTIRQPIYGILVLAVFAVLVLDVPLTGWTVSTDSYSTDQKMLENLGLTTLLVASLLIAVFSASSVLAREIEDRTALTVISKPVSRSTFVLGKFAGVAGAVVLAFYLCLLVFMMTVRHGVLPTASDVIDWPVIVIGSAALAMVLLIALLGNLFFGWTFTSAAVGSGFVLLSVAMLAIGFVDKGWKLVPPSATFGPGTHIHPNLMLGVLLMFMAMLVLVALAVAVSTRLGQVMTLLVCFAVFVVGSIHNYFFERWADQGIVAAKYIGWLVPNLTYFYPFTEKGVPWEYVGWLALYCLAFIAAILSLGIAAFQTRPLESQATSASMPGAVFVLAWVGRITAAALAIIALVYVSLPQMHSAPGILIVAVLLAVAAANWLLWGFFARGARWSYWVTMVLALLALLQAGAALAGGQALDFARFNSPDQRLIVEAAVAGAVLLILALPKTRRHFR